VPEDIIRLYDPNPPQDREGLVYRPPIAVDAASRTWVADPTGARRR
jgi:hypothetical protein